MGGWFSKWTGSNATATATANVVTCSKPITDPHILRQFEDQIYGIELTMPPKREACTPMTQSGIIHLEKLI